MYATKCMRIKAVNIDIKSVLLLLTVSISAGAIMLHLTEANNASVTQQSSMQYIVYKILSGSATWQDALNGLISAGVIIDTGTYNAIAMILAGYWGAVGYWELAWSIAYALWTVLGPGKFIILFGSIASLA